MAKKIIANRPADSAIENSRTFKREINKVSDDYAIHSGISADALIGKLQRRAKSEAQTKGRR